MDIEQFTYKDLTRTVNREEMLEQDVSRLGTQAGNFGLFKEQARIVTWSGSKQIQTELMWKFGKDLSKLLDECPTLKALIQ
tara:strand:- start:3228 stop:3470 length:243 start_codon:yes stop_codon:yes gene_type:complete